VALNFPNNPGIGSIFTDTTAGFSYEWNGTVWKSFTPASSSNIKILDDISSSFTGVVTSFSLSTGGISVTPLNAQQLIITLGGVIQKPGTDYTVSSSTILFTSAPEAALSFSGISLGPAAPITTIPDGTVTDGSLTVLTTLKVGTAVTVSGGIVTATTFSGNITGTAATFTGNVSIAGTLTYEDVTNVDSVGLITARTGVRVTAGGLVVTAGVSTFAGITTVTGETLFAKQLNVSGVSTFAGITTVTGETLFAKQLNVSGIVTATGGFNLGISSAGTSITSGAVKTLNFIGTGNTFAVSGTTVDISIAGGGSGASFNELDATLFG